LFLDDLAVVSVYQNNILDMTRKKDAPMWIITQVISELTLEDFVEKRKSEVTFHNALLLTRQLLEIVQRCHKVNIFHRNIQPNNIMVQHSNDQASLDDIKLVLIDFGLAWIDSQELSITNEDDLKIFNQIIKRHLNKNLKQPSANDFCPLQHFLSLSSKSRCCNPAIDSTAVCRILFWLLTDKWPDQVYYTTNTYPHYENEYQQKINEKLGRII
jgi:serine/threonine protein kinase